MLGSCTIWESSVQLRRCDLLGDTEVGRRKLVFQLSTRKRSIILSFKVLQSLTSSCLTGFQEYASR